MQVATVQPVMCVKAEHDSIRFKLLIRSPEILLLHGLSPSPNGGLIDGSQPSWLGDMACCEWQLVHYSLGICCNLSQLNVRAAFLSNRVSEKDRAKECYVPSVSWPESHLPVCVADDMKRKTSEGRDCVREGEKAKKKSVACRKVHLCGDENGNIVAVCTEHFLVNEMFLCRPVQLHCTSSLSQTFLLA